MIRRSLAAGLVAGALLVGGAAAPAIAATSTATPVALKATTVSVPTSLVLHSATNGKLPVTVTFNRALDAKAEIALEIDELSAAGGAELTRTSSTSRTYKATLTVPKTTKPGKYHVEILAGGLDDEDPTIDVTKIVTVKRATGLSLKASKTTIAKGSTVSLSGTLTRVVASGSTTKAAAFAGQTVKIYADPAGSAPKKLLTTLKTSSKGTYSKTFKPGHSATYTVVYAGSASYASKTSTAVVVHLK
ncbi:hypothetical protein [Luteimicrobium sp. DT211]|uniref:hypothetical protein n=1 Tax=Luteimicrobium sp. DT211 TaxID=3393412 RepID=UPI003CE832DF